MTSSTPSQNLPDNFEINMAAQPGNPILEETLDENTIDPNTSLAEGTGIITGSHDAPHCIPVPAMDDESVVEPASNVAAGSTTPEVIAMDGVSLSVISPFSPPSPLVPPRAAQKRVSPSGTPSSSREPSPGRYAGPPPVVHRRVDVPGDVHDDRFKQIEAQAQLDHDYMDGLSANLHVVSNRSSSNELSIKWLRRAL